MMIRPLQLLPILLLILLPFAASADEADPPNDVNDRPKVAVVLGGGGGHAIAHLGALE